MRVLAIAVSACVFVGCASRPDTPPMRMPASDAAKLGLPAQSNTPVVVHREDVRRMGLGMVPQAGVRVSRQAAQRGLPRGLHRVDSFE